MSHEKYQHLLALLRDCRRVIVALSGGLDSSFLLYAAVQANGVAATLAAIGVSDSLAESERAFAADFARSLGLSAANIITIATREIEDDNYAANPPNRCYFCKSELYTRLNDLAAQREHEVVCDGANASDLGDHRPGMIAARERRVRSPLLEADLTKDEIRALAREFGLSVWDKPQSACLASRIPYGSTVTPEKLRQIDQAESFLRSLGFTQLRVRHHDQIARIELPVADMSRVINNGIREQINRRFHEIGFLFVTLDVAGFQSGSMNAMLKGRSDE
ncbi:MAG: ATP-dependent sacrificial sulfur transferase LarE [candidate division Zixibacteria bacterium]|nr:ATP-dependent sacrificial sulfur transferase LarE [candidate division Zixibacteria bacterium]